MRRARKRTDEAIADLARVPDDHYMAAQARLLAGQVELRRDRLRFAEEAFRASVLIDPTLVQAHRELIYIYGLQLRRTPLDGEYLALSSLKGLTFKEVFHWCLLQNDSWEPGEAASMMKACDGGRSGRPVVTAGAGGERPADWGCWMRPKRSWRGCRRATPRGWRPAPGSPSIARTSTGRSDCWPPASADDPVLATLRGRLALERQDFRSALHHFRIAYAADPDRRETLSSLIAALLRVGDVEAAAPLREIAARRERLASLIQRAAMPGAKTTPPCIGNSGPLVPPCIATPQPAPGTSSSSPATRSTRKPSEPFFNCATAHRPCRGEPRLLVCLDPSCRRRLSNDLERSTRGISAAPRGSTTR